MRTQSTLEHTLPTCRELKSCGPILRRFAFIQFSSRAEAVAALDHPDPVLGDPLIKLNWAHHNFESAKGGRGKGVEGKGGKPTRTPSSEGAYPASSRGGRGKAVSDATAAVGGGRGSAVRQGVTVGRGPSSSKLTVAQLKAQREQMIKAQIEEQKALIAKLGSMKNVSKEERAAMMAQVAFALPVLHI